MYQLLLSVLYYMLLLIVREAVVYVDDSLVVGDSDMLLASGIESLADREVLTLISL